MPDDPLDAEIALAVDIPGLAKIALRFKSRALSAVDHLCGNALDYFLGSGIALKQGKARANIEGEVARAHRLDAALLEKMDVDPAFLDRALQRHLTSLTFKQTNVDAVVQQAIEDLQSDPISQEDEAGPDKLDQPFLLRFERHAQEASTEELQAKWARVLASEVRRPGTFSAKALRIVDELDPETAAKFERVCESRLRDIIPVSVAGELNFNDLTQLVGAGLLVEHGLGQHNMSRLMKTAEGEELWVWGYDQYSVALKKVAETPTTKTIVAYVDGNPAIGVYVLTAVGRAIASILPNHTRKAAERLLNTLAEEFPTTDACLYEFSNPDWTRILTISARERPS